VRPFVPSTNGEISIYQGVVAEIPAANIKEFLVTILSEAKPPQTQCLSLKGEFWVCSKANLTLECSKILFRERKGISATTP
jgi:hypothetical protein